MNHDIGALDIGSGHRIEIAPDRLCADSRGFFWPLGDDRDMARTRWPSAASHRAAARPRSPKRR